MSTTKTIRSTPENWICPVSPSRILHWIEISSALHQFLSVEQLKDNCKERNRGNVQRLIKQPITEEDSTISRGNGVRECAWTCLHAEREREREVYIYIYKNSYI